MVPAAKTSTGAAVEARARAQEQSTAAPQRNFSLSTEDRIRVLVAGPPAYLRRLRAIEDLEEAIIQALVEKGAKASREGLEAEAEAEKATRGSFPAASYRKLCDLVAQHNRYYPVEANLPMRPRTGDLVDRDGAAWRPRRCLSVEEFILRARAGGGAVAVHF